MKQTVHPRTIAVAEGRTRYFTGLPCARGHVAERNVATCVCAACKAEDDAKYAKANRERFAKKLAAWKAEHPGAFLVYAKRYYENNKEKCNAASTKWTKENYDKVKAAVALNQEGRKAAAKKYKANHRHISAANTMRRYARKLNATPPWADESKIRRVYEEAEKWGMQVDHVIPLLGKTVCGLHVETNLQLLTAKENRLKGDKFDGENW